MVGRDILTLGINVNMTSDKLFFSRCVNVNACELYESREAVDFRNIDTDAQIVLKQRLVEILQEFEGSFATGIATSRVKTGQLEIRLIDPSRTVQRRPYRLSVEEKAVVRDKVKQLLNAGVIRPSCSPFSSPVLLVKKKDGSDRMCIDYASSTITQSPIGILCLSSPIR